MWNIGRVILIGAFLMVSQSSCGSVTPHENFTLHMKSKMGMNFDDPPRVTGINPERFISSKILPNGNLENGYLFRGTCRYFYEIDQKTRKIVGWRFEGSERDCEIAP